MISCTIMLTGVTRQRQLVSLNQHFSDRHVVGLSAPKGMKIGGTPVIGESECCTFKARGLLHTLRLSIYTDDLVTARVCRRCERLCGLLCSCSEQGDTFVVSVRYSTIRTIVAMVCYAMMIRRVGGGSRGGFKVLSIK